MAESSRTKLAKLLPSSQHLRRQFYIVALLLVSAMVIELNKFFILNISILSELKNFNHFFILSLMHMHGNLYFHIETRKHTYAHPLFTLLLLFSAALFFSIILLTWCSSFVDARPVSLSTFFQFGHVLCSFRLCVYRLLFFRLCVIYWICLPVRSWISFHENRADEISFESLFIQCFVIILKLKFVSFGAAISRRCHRFQLN